MPYKIRKRGPKWCVTRDGKTVGCHTSKAKAEKQVKAIGANSQHGATAIQFGREIQDPRTGRLLGSRRSVGGEIIPFEDEPVSTNDIMKGWHFSRGPGEIAAPPSMLEKEGGAEVVKQLEALHGTAMASEYGIVFDDSDDTAAMAERGQDWGSHEVVDYPMEDRRCHWNSVAHAATDPDRLKVVTGYAYVPGYRHLDVWDYDSEPRAAQRPPSESNPTNEAGKPLSRDAIWPIGREPQWIAHSWVHDTETGAIIETTRVEYGGYFGFEMTRPETRAFGKMINEQKAVPWQKF